MLKTEAFVNPLQDNSGYKVSPEILLWRSVIVRTILDSMGVDIHAWGYSRKRIIEDSIEWFHKSNQNFILVCDYADLEPDFVLRLKKKIQDKNALDCFKNKNLHKFILEYICTFAGEQ
jgi:hypothetical protein